MNELSVALPGRSYRVLVGAGARHRLCEVVPVGVERAAIVTQEGIPWPVDSGLEQKTFVIGDGEDEKNLETVEQLCRGFARWGLHRKDVVVAVGGGVVTDVAGFAAAVYHRGVPVVHVPTSLLGQVDAAIGGKTGVNLPEGKNLVGSFWQPEAVLCDTDTLTTLPPWEYRSGLGEMAKYAFLGVEGLRDMALEDAIAACVACKTSFVVDDERESGRRALLNYGHTLAHALETAAGYDLRHGEAVAVGLVFAARLAERLGRIGPERVKEHRDLVTSYDLPADPPPGLDADDLITIMGRDKKATGSHLTFVLDGPRGIEVVPGVPVEAVRQVLVDADVSRDVVLLLSGPNLQLLGQREPAVYGTETLDDHVRRAASEAARFGLTVEHQQSDHEGRLVELVHEARNRVAALVINPGALTHYGWSLHDALATFEGPVIELHLSNPRGREAWRHTSVVAPVATGSITGLGGVGYRLAVEAVAALLGRSPAGDDQAG